MPSSINLDNGAQVANISLAADGILHFNFNNTNDTRVSINDDNGIVTIGGGQGGVGRTGGLQLQDASGVGTIFLGADNQEAGAILGGGNGNFNGRIQLARALGPTTIDLQGSNGNCRVVSLTETSDLRLKKGIAPLLNALDKVLAMRGVRYQRKQEDSPKKGVREQSQIGFIGQEMESVCPEIVSTDSEGYKSLNYTRLTPMLVEAIKEQQQFIQQQAAVLGEALKKIAMIETAMKEQSA